MSPFRLRVPSSGSILSRVCSLVGLLALSCAVPAQAQTLLYASPNGSSTSTCDVSVPCSLTRAQAYVQTLTPSMTSDIIVNLAAGTYTLSSTWAFNSANGDSGTGGHNVIWQASGYGTPSQASVTISGGTQITGWSQWDATKNIWKARDAYNTRQLYVNGIRAQRATGALPVTLTANGNTGYTASSNAMASWHNPSAIEFVFELVNFIERRCDVSSISGTSINMDNPCFTNSRLNLPAIFPTYVENAYEMLSQPGQWYFDSSGTVDGSGFTTVYYIPRAGESMSTATVMVPVLQTLLSGTGTLAAPLQNVEFKGLTFAYGTWLGPNSTDGFVEAQANTYVTGVNAWSDPVTTCCFAKNMSRIPGNVTFSAAHNIRLEGNLFIHLGGVGVNLENGSQTNTVIGNEFTDISGNSVQIGDPNGYSPTDARADLVGNTVQDNYIHDTPAEYHGGVGIVQFYTQNDVITHNQIDNLPYDGISSGWGFGGITPYTQGNQFTDNLIYNAMTYPGFSDGGGLYTNGQQGTTLAGGALISGNAVHDQQVGTALYTDEGSEYITLQNNALYSLATGVIDWGGCVGNTSGQMTFQSNYGPGLTATYSGVWGCGAQPPGITSSNNTAISTLSDCTAIPACQSIVSSAGLEPAWQCLLSGTCAGGGGTTTVDDSTQGAGINQFNYVGTSWGHCVGATNCGSSTYYNNTASWGTATGDYVLFKFTGTQVKFYGAMDIHEQMVGLSICDANGANCGSETIVDQYGATQQGNVLQWTSPVQASGTYTLKVRVTGQHNASAVPDGTNYYGIVDRVDVVTGAATTVDDSVQGASVNQFNYVGASWGHCVGATNCGSSTYYNNTASWGTATNDYALFKFTGTQVKFYGAMDIHEQMVGLSICDQNGANCGTETIVDQYGATQQGNVLQWTSPAQVSGTYTLKVRVTGQHNASAVPDGTNYYGIVDRADAQQ